jgi:type IV secretion system protein VirD4
MGQRVHVLDLRDGKDKSDCLNPLDLAVRCGTEPAAVARSFAAQFIERGEERDRFWSDWAETMITAGIAWLLEDCPPEKRQLSTFFDLLTEGDADFAIGSLLDKPLTSRAAAAGFSGYLQLPERETRPSVLGSTLAPLRLFDSELARRVTGSTSIDLDALIAGAPMTLYIIVPPVRLAAYKPLLRAWLSGLLYALTQRTALPEHRTLLLCDEIASLGPMEAFLMASTMMRGWGLTLWSFWQNPSQLEIYGHQARTLVDNAGVLQLFGARNRRVAQDFAALVGGVDPDAIMAMPRDAQLLMIDGEPPSISRRIRYFEEPMFKGLYDANPMFSSRR